MDVRNSNEYVTLPATTQARPIASVTMDPLFILGLPRSFTSVVAAMLGQHPQMYGLPETHLFSYETMEERSEACSQATYTMAHGLLRSVAQLYFNAQTDRTIKLASG